MKQVNAPKAAGAAESAATIPSEADKSGSHELDRSCLHTPPAAQSAPRISLDPTNPDDEIPVIELDMDAIYKAAKNVTVWDLEFDCHGITFKWAGKAGSRAMAELKARAELSELSHNFNRYKARLVGAVVLP